MTHTLIVYKKTKQDCYAAFRRDGAVAGLSCVQQRQRNGRKIGQYIMVYVPIVYDTAGDNDNNNNNNYNV